MCGDNGCRYRHDYCDCGALKRKGALRCRPCFERDYREARTAVDPDTGRLHARQTFDIEGAVCERDGCEAPAIDLHHRDEDTFNNDRSNVERLCRLHHAIEHGVHGEHGPGANPSPCTVCGREYAPLRRGRCSRCATHFYKWRVEWPSKA